MTRTDKTDPARGTVVEEAVLPVVEERVRIDKTVEQGRTVTVTTRPVTETETLSQKLAHERVTVERVPIGQVVSEIPSVREEGDLTVIPVVEQRARVVVEQVPRPSKPSFVLLWHRQQLWHRLLLWRQLLFSHRRQLWHRQLLS